MKRRFLTCFFILMAVIMFAGCKKAADVKCGNKIKDINVKDVNIGVSFLVKCPAGCTIGSVWGTDTYTMDSSICKAAIHAGAITAEKGGIARISIKPSIPKYSGSERNGITTSDWPNSWGAKAFTVSKD